MKSQSLICEQRNGIGIITLNSPKNLNALNLEMILSMTEALKNWAKDSRVKCILLKSSLEKAFCAGGDVVSLYLSLKNKNDDANQFFESEYALDLMIHEYQKPIVCLANGITMGGGIGIMNGSSHRVVTESSMLAMPEITIGLFPDVGGSYFLNKKNSLLGLFIGLSGARMNASDALYIEMADYFIKSSFLLMIEDELTSRGWSDSNKENYNIVSRILAPKVEASLEAKPISNLFTHYEEILKLTTFKNIFDLDSYWRGYKTHDKFLNKAISLYLQGSPTSAALIFEQLQRGKTLSIQQAFAQERKMVQTICNQGDFQEGVRALLIEKDNNPNWRPQTLSEVNNQLISTYFN